MQAMDGELLVENPRFALADGSDVLRLAEFEDAAMIDMEFSSWAQSCDALPDSSVRSGWTPDLQIVEHYVQRSQARGVEVWVDFDTLTLKIYGHKPRSEMESDY